MESFIRYYYSMKIRGVVSSNLQGWDATIYKYEWI
jgi:hypothetical protein